jgi:GMP synthase-like glutamine amidotransferase
MDVLAVVHEGSATGGGGLFEERAAALGHAVTRWVASEEEPPGPPDAFGAVIVFGGATHPDEDAVHPWLGREAAYIGDVLAHGVPLLGVCLGSQLLARAAGGGVERAATPEIGWHAVELTEEGVADPVLGVLPRRVTAFQWHYYAWRLPADGALLAASPAAPQAFRLGDRAWGVQFHPEVTPLMVETWTTDGADELPGAPDALRRETAACLPAWNAHGAALCDAFLAEAPRLA